MTALLLALLLAGQTAWTSMRSAPQTVLEGAWQSCPDGDDGAYGERVYVWRQRGRAIAEIHLGPRQEFAVFAGEVDGDRAHTGADNLLGPAFNYEDLPTIAGGRNWALSGLHLRLNVVRGPGSFEECYSFFVKAEAIPYTAASR